jgi:hypothetical protein
MAMKILLLLFFTLNLNAKVWKSFNMNKFTMPNKDVFMIVLGVLGE